MVLFATICFYFAVLVTWGSSENKTTIKSCKFLLNYFQLVPLVMHCYIVGPLNSHPNVMCTPHSAYYSDQSMNEVREISARELRSAILGQIPNSLRYCVNREIFINRGTIMMLTLSVMFFFYEPTLFDDWLYK